MEIGNDMIREKLETTKNDWKLRDEFITTTTYKTWVVFMYGYSISKKLSSTIVSVRFTDSVVVLQSIYIVLDYTCKMRSAGYNFKK